jgi:hypothetical protein
MQVPNFVDPQFVDANGVGGFNASFGTVSGSIASLTSGLYTTPGLIAPEAMGVSFSGLVATVNLPLPWALLTSGARRVEAHGTQTGLDTQTYVVNFAPLLPSSGFINVWMAASATTIQQNPFALVGPPNGQPSYNPQFQPSVAYATTVDTVSVFATTTPPDNVNIFTLLSLQLTAEDNFPTYMSASGQIRAALLKADPGQTIAAGVLTPQQAQIVLQPAAAGQANTLPLSSVCAGLTFQMFNASVSGWTISASGSDRISVIAGAAPFPSIGIAASGAMTFWTTGNGLWAVRAASPTVEVRTGFIFNQPDQTTINFSTPFKTGIPLVTITDAGGFGDGPSCVVYSALQTGITASGFVMTALKYVAASGFVSASGATCSYIAMVSSQ